MAITPSAEFDVRGPVHVEGREVLASFQSVQAVEAEDGAFADCPGLGRWIWSDRSNQATPVRFRKSFRLTKKPATARIWVTADAKYRLWVNGKLAARGPADVGRDYDSGPCGPWLVDQRDVAAYLHDGENVIAVEVYPKPLVQSESTTGEPGLRLDARIGGYPPIATDATWKATETPDLKPYGEDGLFRIDLRKEPIAWQRVGFDDSDWKSASLSARADDTLPSEIPTLMEARMPAKEVVSGSPNVRILGLGGAAEVVGDGEYTVKFGHVLSGYVGFRVHGTPGTRMSILPNEGDGPGTHRRAEVVLRGGEQVFELPYFDSFSLIRLRFEDVDGPIVVRDVSAVFTSFPVAYKGAFRCDDPQLNRFWEVCRWETQICMQTLHLDSPHHQEPISDPGDYLIEALNSYYAFGGSRLAKQDLKKYGRLLIARDYRPFHTSYSLLWLRMLLEYYEHTGDAATVRDLAPVVFGLLDRFEGYLGNRGLISEAPNYMFLDWVELEGFNLHHPPSVLGQGYMTALFIRGLEDAAAVADMVGSSRRAIGFRDLRSRTIAAFQRELWDEAAGLFLDGLPFHTSVPPNTWLPADRDIRTHSTQVNMLAVWSGAAGSRRGTEVLSKVMAREDLNCQPYFMHFVFEALHQAGLFAEHALPQMRRWRVVEDTQTFREMWDRGDLSHAWNGTLLNQLSRRVLGVEPAKPGFREFRITPLSLGLQWAEGSVPTPHGAIQVRWDRKGEDLVCRFTVPRGTRARVADQSFGSGSHQASIPVGGETTAG